MLKISASGRTVSLSVTIFKRLSRRKANVPEPKINNQEVRFYRSTFRQLSVPKIDQDSHGSLSSVFV